MSEEIMNTIEECTTELNCGIIEEGRITLKDSSETEFIGSSEQITEMLMSWNKYLEEVRNPAMNKENTFFKVNGKNSRYASMDEILDTIKPCLTKHGFSFFQVPTVNADIVSVQFIMIHANGGMINFPKLSIRTEKLNAQNIGSVLTYARRYQLGSICGIAGDDDDDANSVSKDDVKLPKEKSTKAKTPKEILIEACTEKAAINKEEVLSILAKYGKKDGKVMAITNAKEITDATEEIRKIGVE